jgi:hypothetical protein
VALIAPLGVHVGNVVRRNLIHQLHQIVFAKAFGLANVEFRIPVTNDTDFKLIPLPRHSRMQVAVVRHGRDVAMLRFLLQIRFQARRTRLRARGRVRA